MEIQRVFAVYFSPTGGTKKVVTTVANAVSTALQVPLAVYDFTLPESRNTHPTFTEQDLVFFGTPVIAGRVPNLMVPYIQAFIGSGAYGVPMVSFGNRDFDDALIELRELMESCGFRTIAGGAFVSEHSFSTTLGAGRPDEKDIAKLKEFAEKLVAKIQSDFVYTKPIEVTGQFPIRPHFIPRDRHEHAIDIRKVKPKTNDSCVGCGHCVEVCPMGSIEEVNFSCVGVCIKCNACVKLCPLQAKYFDDEDYIYHKEELEYLYQRRAEPSYFL